MKIQIITNNERNFVSCEHITYASINAPNTLDAFDLNIIDLQRKEIWRNYNNTHKTIDTINDFKSLQKNLENSKKSTTIILLPQNYMFCYDYDERNDVYEHSIQLKDMLLSLFGILKDLFPSSGVMGMTRSGYGFDLIYENSQTKCGNTSFIAAFTFAKADHYKVLTKCIMAEKPTTIQRDNIIVTTLNLQNNKKNLDDFLYALGLTGNKPEYPQWLIDLEKFDDKILNATIKKEEAKIVELQNSIKEAQIKLQKNLRLKSILTENGDNLVEVVFDILSDVLSCDLSEFRDKKREDFLIKLADCTFIGEIKGINTNVKSANVSQLDVHYQNYLDDLADKNTKEKVKALLVINSQRDKPVKTRDDVHEEQIMLAKRNGSLIIPTITLLSIYEKFLDKQITSEQIIEMFLNQVGLIDFNI